jgi:hypothetical protein
MRLSELDDVELAVLFPKRRAPSIADLIAASEVVGTCAACGGPVLDGDELAPPDTDRWHRLCAIRGSDWPQSAMRAEVRDARAWAGLREVGTEELNRIAWAIYDERGASLETEDALRALRLAKAGYGSPAEWPDIPKLKPLTTPLRELRLPGPAPASVAEGTA